MGLPFAYLLYSMAKRKGGNRWLYFLGGFIPVYSLFLAIWMASLPEKKMVQELTEFIKELSKYKLELKPEYWMCSCGAVNDLKSSNCPECGIKKEYLLKQK